MLRAELHCSHETVNQTIKPHAARDVVKAEPFAALAGGLGDALQWECSPLKMYRS